MNPIEANAVLALAGQYDGRKPDADTAIEWAGALRGLHLEDCMAAVRAHYLDTDRWIGPFHIKTRVRAVRNDRIERGMGQLAPPRWLDDIEDDGQHAIAYQRWQRDAMKALADGLSPDSASQVRTPIPADVKAELTAAFTPAPDDSTTTENDPTAEEAQ